MLIRAGKAGKAQPLSSCLKHSARVGRSDCVWRGCADAGDGGGATVWWWVLGVNGRKVRIECGRGGIILQNMPIKLFRHLFGLEIIYLLKQMKKYPHLSSNVTGNKIILKTFSFSLEFNTMADVVDMWFLVKCKMNSGDGSVKVGGQVRQ